MNIVQQNPIACTLIGLGLGIYIVNLIRNADGGSSRVRAYQPEFEAGMPVPRHVSEARQYALTHRTAETVSHLGHQAKEGAMRAGRGFQHLVEENPLAAGAAAVAVGAMVGLALPSTRVHAMDKVKAGEQPGLNA